MVQKHEYIDYQPVSPSRLQHTPVQERCKLGAKSEGEVVIVQDDCTPIDWAKVRSAWHQARPARMLARRIVLVAVTFGAAAAVVGFALYRIGLVLYDAGVAVGQAITDALPAIGVGAGFCLFVLVAYYIANNTRKARPFDDWHHKPKTTNTDTQTNGRPIVINQIVNVNDGQ